MSTILIAKPSTSFFAYVGGLAEWWVVSAECWMLNVECWLVVLGCLRLGLWVATTDVVGVCWEIEVALNAWSVQILHADKSICHPADAQKFQIWDSLKLPKNFQSKSRLISLKLHGSDYVDWFSRQNCICDISHLHHLVFNWDALTSQTSGNLQAPGCLEMYWSTWLSGGFWFPDVFQATQNSNNLATMWKNQIMKFRQVNSNPTPRRGNSMINFNIGQTSLNNSSFPTNTSQPHHLALSTDQHPTWLPSTLHEGPQQTKRFAKLLPSHFWHFSPNWPNVLEISGSPICAHLHIQNQGHIPLWDFNITFGVWTSLRRFQLQAFSFNK